MSTRPPFEFDLRVSSDKKRRKTGRRGMSGAFETSQKKCEYPGCAEQGAYRAPKSPDHLDEYFWFCKDHVREYNLKWNFFQGSTDEEFQKFLDEDRVWGRATNPSASARMRAAPGRGWGWTIRWRSLAKRPRSTRPSPPAMRPASCPPPNARRWKSSMPATP
jgi:hypothetical protein